MAITSCSRCHGTGRVPCQLNREGKNVATCHECGGSGRVQKADPPPKAASQRVFNSRHEFVGMVLMTVYAFAALVVGGVWAAQQADWWLYSGLLFIAGAIGGFFVSVVIAAIPIAFVDWLLKRRRREKPSLPSP